MAIEHDTTININWHELRILTIWASNWATHACRESEQKALDGVIGRLQKQRKPGWPALTILGEIQELPEVLEELGIECGRVELYNGKERVHPPKLRIVKDDDEA